MAGHKTGRGFFLGWARFKLTSLIVVKFAACEAFVCRLAVPARGARWSHPKGAIVRKRTGVPKNGFVGVGVLSRPASWDGEMIRKFRQPRRAWTGSFPYREIRSKIRTLGPYNGRVHVSARLLRLLIPFVAHRPKPFVFDFVENAVGHAGLGAIVSGVSLLGRKDSQRLGDRQNRLAGK